MADLEIWKDYVTVINAARMNAIRDHIKTNEGNISYHQTLINANTTDIHNNASGISYNTNNIANLSDIKLSRDGSQPMTGELRCNSGIKTDTIDTMTEAMLSCQKPLQIDSRLYGNSSVGLWLYSDFDIYASSIRLYSYNSSLPGKILVSTPGNDTLAITRIEIPGKVDFADIKVRESDVLPYNDDYQSLGNSSYRWKNIYSTNGNFSTITAIEGNFSAITPLNNVVLPIKGWLDIKWGKLWSGGVGCDGLSLYSGDFQTTTGSAIILYNENSPNQGSIDFLTRDGTGNLKTRIWIWGGYDKSWVVIYDANLIPGDDNSNSLGQSDKRWEELYAVKGYFTEINAEQINPSMHRLLPFHLENPSSSDKYLLGAGTVSTMYQFNTTVTLTAYKLMILTSNSSGYIKVSIDDANGWTYEKTYSLGSAGGYRYNESFNHVIETTNGIQLKISNCSNISSTTIVLEYK